MAKILLFGQAAFGSRVLEGILEAGHEVTAVCVPPDSRGRPLDPLKEKAIESGLRVVQRTSYRSSEAAQEVDAAGADLGVLAFVTQIIPREILDAPRLASVCFHPSLLPAYRGGSAIAWQLINGETRGGVTLFRPDDGIDSGPIYLCRELEIGADDSAGSYYYSRVFEPGIAATLEVVEGLLAGSLEGVVQDESKATHDPLCKDEHAGVDWTRSCRELHNLIRGCDPAPGAFTRSQGVPVRLYGSRSGGEADDVAAAPGTVVSIDTDGLRVAAADGLVTLTKIAVGGDTPIKKGPAAEVAEAAGIEVGNVLGVD